MNPFFKQIHILSGLGDMNNISINQYRQWTFLRILTILLFRTVHSTGTWLIIPLIHCSFRYGFNTPKNFNDNELYCGGWSRQHQKNNGQCGVCGDPWDLVSVSRAFAISIC